MCGKNGSTGTTDSQVASNACQYSWFGLISLTWVIGLYRVRAFPAIERTVHFYSEVVQICLGISFSSTVNVSSQSSNESMGAFLICFHGINDI